MKKEKLLIRKCLPSDLVTVLHLMAQLGEFAHVEFKPDPGNFKKIFTAMEKRPETYINLICVQNDQIAGFLSMVFYRSFLHKVGSALINELVVDEAGRGQGIGKRLVEAAIAEARKRGMDEIEVSTEVDNLAAREFYRRVGFDEEYVLLGKEF